MAISASGSIIPHQEHTRVHANVQKQGEKKIEGTPKRLSDLPPDILRLLFKRMEGRSIGVLALVCKQIRQILIAETSWKQWFLERKYSAKLPRELDVNEIYAATHRLPHRMRESGHITLENLPRVVEGNQSSLVLKLFPDNKTKVPNFLSALSQQCPWLKKLSVKANVENEHSWMTDDDLGTFLTRHNDLTSLTLEGCSALTEAGILTVLAACKELRRIKIESNCFTAPVVQHLVSGRIHLRSLTMIGEMVEDSDILGEIVSKKDHLAALSKVHIQMRPSQGTSQPPFSQWDANFFFSQMGNLQEITLEGCTEVDDRTIEHIAERNGCHLRKLTLYGCSQVTGVCIQFIGQSCPHLTELSLFDTQNPKEIRKKINQLHSEQGFFKSIRHCLIK